MAKKAEKKNELFENIEQFKEDYIQYQNKMTGNDMTDPVTFAYILSGIQKDILNIYNILSELSKK